MADSSDAKSPSDAASLVWIGLVSIVEFVRLHPLLVIWIILFGVCIDLVGSWVFATAVRPITVYYDGSLGSSNYRLKDHVEEAIRGISTVPNVKFRALAVQTAGLEDTKTRLQDDPDGQAIGIISDTHGSELRTLLPLDWDFCHVLARVGFLEDVRKKTGGRTPATFADVKFALDQGRVYAGNPGSEAYVIASKLFDRFKSDVSNSFADYVAPGITDWEQAEAALKAGKLDLAIYAGPIGATTVQSIADDSSAALVSLDGVQETLCEDADSALTATEIPKNSYRAAPVRFPVSPVQGAKQTTWLFCGDKVKTVAARRLIVASKRMATGDAYLLAGALDDTLTDKQDVPASTWKLHHPHEEPAASVVALGVMTHPGAEMKRDGSEPAFWWKPSSWSPFWRTTIAGFLSIALTAAVHFAVGKVQRLKEQRDDAKPAPDIASSQSTRVKAALAAFQKRLDDYEHGRSATSKAALDSQYIRTCADLSDSLDDIPAELRESLERAFGELMERYRPAEPPEESVAESHGEPPEAPTPEPAPAI